MSLLPLAICHFEGRTYAVYSASTAPKVHLPLTKNQKLAPLLVEALISREVDPATKIVRAATGFMFNEIDVDNCFPGGVLVAENLEKRSGQ